MKPKELPSKKELEKILIYDKDTGFLIKYKKHTHRDKNKNNIGTLSNKGYLSMRFNNKTYSVHRIIWQLLYDNLTKNDQIDHINGIRSDNRISNLRKVNVRENARNRCKTSRNSTGFPGVSLFKTEKRMRYRASIKVNRVSISLGLYDTPEEANLVRMEADKKYGFIRRYNLQNFSITGGKKDRSATTEKERGIIDY